MRKNYSNIILIVSAVLLIVLIGSFLYFLNIIKNKNRHISSTEIAIEEKLADIKNVDVLKKKMIELGDTEEKLTSYFVDTNSVDLFVEYLENIGTDNNVILTVKSVKIPVDDKNTILINIFTSGNFEDSMKVLSLIENAPYSIVINSIYLNQELRENITDTTLLDKKLETPKREDPTWGANITFSVKSL